MDNNTKFIFLDRDGTIIEEKEYLSDPEQVRLLPGVAEGMKRMQDAGYRLVVVSNQSGVGRGYYTRKQMDAVNRRMSELLREYGVELDGIYCCIHAPDENCECRKPKTGLIDEAVADLNINPDESVVIGDKASDIGLGRAVGAKTILVRTGYGREYEADGYHKADIIVDSLPDACSALTNQH